MGLHLAFVHIFSELNYVITSVKYLRDGPVIMQTKSALRYACDSQLTEDLSFGISRPIPLRDDQEACRCLAHENARNACSTVLLVADLARASDTRRFRSRAVVLPNHEQLATAPLKCLGQNFQNYKTRTRGPFSCDIQSIPQTRDGRKKRSVPISIL
jgi:hypothetical protein